MVLTDANYVEAFAAGKTVQWQKATSTTVSGFFYSLFRSLGMPGPATAPGTAAGQALSRTSTGAMPIPAASLTSYLTSFEAVSTIPGTFILADRLVETGALSGIVTTAQTVNSVALPARATAALDVELWLEVYTALGATASASVTASYTNQAGVAGRTATLVGGFPANGGPANRTYQMALQAGDTGVQSVQSVTVGTSTATAGAFGVVLRRSLIIHGVAAAGIAMPAQGWAETDLQVIPDEACLELLWLATATASGNAMGNFGIAQK